MTASHQNNDQEPEYVDILADSYDDESGTVTESKPPPYETLPWRPLNATSANNSTCYYVGPDIPIMAAAPMAAPETLISTAASPGLSDDNNDYYSYAIQRFPSPSYESSHDHAVYQEPSVSRDDIHQYTSPIVYCGPDSPREPQDNEYEGNIYDYADPGLVEVSTPISFCDGRKQVAPSFTQDAATANSTPAAAKKRTWLPWSIVTLVVLCLPLGIPAIILSVMAGADYKHGRHRAARKKAKAALVLNILATVVGGTSLFILVGGVLFFLGLLACCCASR